MPRYSVVIKYIIYKFGVFLAQNLSLFGKSFLIDVDANTAHKEFSNSLHGSLTPKYTSWRVGCKSAVSYEASIK